ncbi:MAG TPA: hypothetical protein VMK53_00270 [Gemmatimonadales bacterium]|nr:hypothetical protein [Gemmatimonadales bacterium]
MIPREVRVGVAVLGMLLAAFGVILGNRVVVWVAIGVLAVAYVLRFFMVRTPPVDEEDSRRP